MENNDKITEVYYGNLYSEKVQNELRDRVHWICSQVNGRQILDIGCSQGIVSILLAREGFNVVGIDIDNKAIDYANAEKAKQPEEVQNKLTFIRSSIFDVNLPVNEYDTIVMGEFLEHLVKPQNAVQKAYDLLAYGGNLVLTVPFGLLNFFDHKHTFYISSLYKMLVHYFVINKTEIIGKRTCLACKRRENILCEDVFNIDLSLVDKMEYGFKKLENRLTNELYIQKNKLRDVEKKLSQVQSEKIELERNIKNKDRDDEILNKKNEELEARVFSLTKEVENREQKIKELYDGKEKLEKSLEDKTKKFIQLEDKHNKLIKKEKEVQQKYEAIYTDANKKIDAASEVDQQLRKACNDRDICIKKLRQRVSVLENSTKFFLGDAIIESVRTPCKFPKKSINSLRWIINRIRHKVSNENTGYPLAPMPVSISSVPKKMKYQLEDISYNYKTTKNEQVSNQKAIVESKEKDLNQLLLTGLYDSPKNISELRVAAILDDFSYQSFKHDCNLIIFRPDNWREVLTIEHPHVLLVESSWQGNGGSWQYKIAKYNTYQGTHLDELLQWCKENNIPRVFWNKEDPVHFERFIDTAKKFDFIFTTDKDCVAKYQKMVGHDNIDVLCFAMQPKLHNPIQINGYKTKNVCFAGSYYATRHPDRKLDLENILDASRNFGLEIYDRNYGSNSEQLRFPERFQDHIVGSLPYERLVKEYKRYKVFINVNSVQNSPTMFSRRVYELLACGTFVVSTYSKGIRDIFKGIVPMVGNYNSCESVIRKSLQDEKWRRSTEVLGIRYVYNNHTYAHRLYRIAKKCGFYVNKPYNYHVRIFAYIRDVSNFDKIYECYKKQDYNNKSLVVLVEDLSIPKEFTESDEITVIRFKNLDDIDQNNLLEDVKYVVCFEEGKEYYKEYLTDLVHAAIYSDADVISRSDELNFESATAYDIIEKTKESYVYTFDLSSKSFLINKNSILNFDIKLFDILIESRSISAYCQFGLRIFNIHPFIFNDTEYDRGDCYA